MTVPTFRRFTLTISTAAAMLSGCGGSPPPIGATGASLQSSAIATQADRSFLSKHRTKCPCLYVANLTHNSVTVYASGATGNVKPIQDIQGSKTGLDRPRAVAVNGSGNIYVANAVQASVTVYPAGTTGNAKPIYTISGSKTGLHSPTGIAVDSVNGDIYVSNLFSGRSGKGSVTIYASGSNGDVSPLGALQGAKTKIESPSYVALDGSGGIYVTNVLNETGYVTFYPAGSTGDVSPTRTIEGDLTEMKLPVQVAVDSSKNAYVANRNDNSLTAYAAGANGNVSPIQDIHGARTQLHAAIGVVVDGAGNIYAASGIGELSIITVYAVGSTGNVHPIATIAGDRTGLGYPQGIAIH